MTKEGWPRESIKAAIEDCAEVVGFSPSLKTYELWRQDHHPSGRAVCNEFGSWNAAKEAVGLETYQSFNSKYNDE